MNEAEVVLYHLKQQQTCELSLRFKPHVAHIIEQARDLGMVAWGLVGGGKRGQALLEVLMKQISDATNAVEMLKPKRRKQ